LKLAFPPSLAFSLKLDAPYRLPTLSLLCIS
jgi:hypothetical protein